jgi:hypothetical protein
MKTNDVIPTYTAKRAEEYSETEIFNLVSSTNDFTSAAVNEIRSNRLVNSLEEGQKLIKTLSEFTIIKTSGE